MDIQKIIYVLRAIGIQGIVRTIQNSFTRDRIESQFAHPFRPTKEISPGSLIRSNPIDGGIQLLYKNARVELLFLTQNLVSICWEPGKPPVPYTISKTNWEVQKLYIKTDTTNTTISSGKIIITIDNNCGLCFSDRYGNIFKRDNPPIQEGDRWSLSTTLAPEEHIFGLGERASSLNLRPGEYTSWNTDADGSYGRGKDPLYIGTPIYLSISKAGSHLLYFENSHRSSFHIDDNFKAYFPSGRLKYYVIFGSLDDIFRQLADLVGYPCLPPKWALGYHQSRWGYRTEAEIRTIIAGFEQHDLPISAIHLDIDYMDGFRVFTFDRNRFPNIKQLTHEMDQKGIKVVASINPAVKRDLQYSVYTDGLSKGVFCQLPDEKILNTVSWPGWCVFPDFTNPTVRSWWQEQYKPLLDAGISGIWHDMNEPASFAAWGDKSFPLTTMHSMDGQGGNHLEAHNIYGLLMNQAGYEAMQGYTSAKRPWILSRAGWAGMQRFAWNWTGDLESSWAALQQTIPTILGLGISGHGFTGVDIGGFSGSPEAELYLRWFQMAAFLPFFRTHSATGTKPREPWVYGEPYTRIIRKFLNLRYQFLQYLYTLAWNATRDGLPLVRPIFWETPQDKSLWDIEDEFLLGESILLAPVLHPHENERQVVLPFGIWYSFWDDQCYPGPTKIELPVSAENIPIFIKGGTVLPLDESGSLVLHYYPNTKINSSSHIYYDRGDGYDTWRVDTFQMITNQSSVQFTWIKSGEYPFSYPNVKIQVHGDRLERITADGVDYPIQANAAVIPVFQTMQLEFK